MTQGYFEEMLRDAVWEKDMNQFNKLCDDYPEHLKRFLDRMDQELEDEKTTLEELFDDCERDYTPEEFDWGSPVGKEVW